MTGPAYVNGDEAIRALRQNLSPRARDIEALERVVEGTQYEGRRSWFDESVPLWERKPCIRYPIVATAIRSNVDLVLGESRFPSITSNPGEDDEEAGGLDEEQSAAVDRAIAGLTERVQFRAAARQCLAHAQGARSVATIVGVRRGRPFIEHVRSRWCERVDIDDLGRVELLEVRYPYSKPEKRADGKWELKVYWYRRVIDAVADTTYLPIPVDKDGREPPPSAWRVDTAKTVTHGLGFCPVHWYAHMREATNVSDIDGTAIHEMCTDEVQGLDFALSQRHRAALFTGDPQLCEFGVEPGANPSGTGREAVVPATVTGGTPDATNKVTAGYEAPRANRPARVKSPGAVWQYEKADARAEYLTLPPEALEALDRHAADLRNKISETLCVVILDPENVKITGAMSGRAIEMLRGRQFDRCDQIRDDFGTNWIVPVVLLLLRVVLATRIQLPELKPVASILQRFVEDDVSAPMLFLRWSPGYMAPDPADEQAIVTAVTTAKEKGIITTRMAVQRVATIFGVTNIDQAVERIEEERKELADELHASMVAMNGESESDGPDGGDEA